MIVKNYISSKLNIQKPFKPILCQCFHNFHKKPTIVVLVKRCFENVQQIYRRTLMLGCDFNKVALQLIEITLRHWCSPVNLLHLFRTPFPKNTSGGLFLKNHLNLFEVNVFINFSGL